jgi:hypothetical protein
VLLWKMNWLGRPARNRWCPVWHENRVLRLPLVTCSP